MKPERDAAAMVPAGDGEARTRWTLALVLALAVAVYVWQAAVEPYHIDELRQVRPYDASLSWVIEKSLEQGQPPLDPIIGSVLQRVTGTNDLVQRLPSILAGVAAVGLLMRLLAGAVGRAGMVVAGLAMIFAPVMLEVVPYARPYALPLAMMLGLLLATDRYLAGHPGYAPAIVVLPILLPLSRTSEPLVFLSALAALVALIRVKVPDVGPRWRLPVMAAIVGLVAVGLPMFAAVRSRGLDTYTTASAPGLRHLWRLVADLPPAIDDGIGPAWAVVVAVVVAAVFVHGQVRTLWWVAPLLLTATGFAVVFFLAVPTSQPYYSRYAYSFVPIVAVALAALVDGVGGGGDRLRSWLGASLVVLVAVPLSSMSVRVMTTTENPDWRAVSAVVRRSATPESLVLIESPGPLGAYRTPYAGAPRYLDPRAMHLSRVVDLVREPEIADETRGLVVVAIGSWGPVAGWSSTAVSGFTVYELGADLPGSQRADALDRLGRSLGPDAGAAIRLAAAALLSEDAEAGRADALVRDVVSGLESPERDLATDLVSAWWPEP